MTVQSRIDSLKDRHASLDERIAAETGRPRPDPDELARIKLEKLRLKQEMERLRGTLLH